MTPDPIQARLANLPEPTLPPDLWPRVQAARARQRERRRRVVAGAAAMLALVVLPMAYVRLVAPPDPAAGAVAITPRAPMQEEPLRTVDRALQRAYEQGATEQELQWLWQRREAIARSQGAAAPQPIEI